MNLNRYCRLGIAALLALGLLQACRDGHTAVFPGRFKYSSFKDSLIAVAYDTAGETSNIFDTALFARHVDSTNDLLEKLDTGWHHELTMLKQLEKVRRHWKDTAQDLAGEIALINENTKTLDSFLASKEPRGAAPCREKDCPVFADVVKSSQTLYLYLAGTLTDSFPVSTGIPKRETPNFSVRVSGPLLKKYTSRKFPGGNYQGLGNMPYTVFVRGGFAIHGTTTGNIAFLGNKASHGCIRLHPLNGRLFYELVRMVGVDNAWVVVRE